MPFFTVNRHVIGATGYGVTVVVCNLRNVIIHSGIAHVLIAEDLRKRAVGAILYDQYKAILELGFVFYPTLGHADGDELILCLDGFGKLLVGFGKAACAEQCCNK